MAHTFSQKLVRVRGVEIAVDSWEELDELMARYGAAAGEATSAGREADNPRRQTTILSGSDRALLERFVKEAERGVPVRDIRIALGRSDTGKVGSALKAWSAQIGLTTPSGGSAFELRQRAKGRVHRMTDEALRASRILLSQ
jgi:hypothetical protein